MAKSIFLKVTNGIDGESVFTKHEKQIDVLSWSWGAHNQGTRHVSTGGAHGKAEVSDLTITKYVDKASAKLLNAVCTGQHIDKATLYQLKSAGDQHADYIEIELSEVFVTSYTTGGSESQGLVTEHITLNFRKFKFEYKVQGDKGKAESGGECTFDVAKQAK